MKCFIDRNTVYYMYETQLHETQIDSYGLFDTAAGSPVRESTDQTERIQMLVTEKKSAQDCVQLSLF
jgi:hypothetical protein